jgi:hypothetical protein
MAGSWIAIANGIGFCKRLARELELPKPTFQVISAHDCDAGQKKGTIEDIQGVLRALPPGNDNRHLHAGDSGKCGEDGRHGQDEITHGRNLEPFSTGRTL